MKTSNSMYNDGFKPVRKIIVAYDPDISDEIEALRNSLTDSNKDVFINQDGTVFNEKDPLSKESVSKGSGFKPVDKAVVALQKSDQWYVKYPDLLDYEKKAMYEINPSARLIKVEEKTGTLGWLISLHPVVCGSRKHWELLAVYDHDHPHKRWGGSVRMYPLSPNINQMKNMVINSGIKYDRSTIIPHLLSDGKEIYLCTQDMNNINDGSGKDKKITSAAACLRFASRWITVFELGLIDQKTWDLFNQHGKI